MFAFRSILIPILVAMALFAWSVGVGSFDVAWTDFETHLAADCLTITAALAALNLARHSHHHDEHLGLVSGAFSPPAMTGVLCKIAMRWVAPLVAAILGAGTALAIVFGATAEVERGSSTSGLIQFATRIAAETMFLAAIAIASTRSPWRSVTTLAVACASGLLWVGHQLAPVSSSGFGPASWNAHTSSAPPVDIAGRASQWGSPSAAIALLAVSVFSAWLLSCAPPTVRPVHAD